MVLFFILAEAFRLLKDGGYLVTATDCYGEPVPFTMKIQIFVMKVFRFFGLIKYLSCFPKYQVTGLLKESGFKIMEDGILHSAPVNYYVLACK